MSSTVTCMALPISRPSLGARGFPHHGYASAGARTSYTTSLTPGTPSAITTVLSVRGLPFSVSAL